ncbi:hydrogenase maturation nickel metallochaperone HypA [Neobacillus sp. MM2021_6]|uniref:hydrogenase maturation nickel metallochaperone HypA/HybF n=1 Tax=Bacillaceae TaxID=186817 RepID=UPI00140BE286|nr:MULTISPECIES: hydrogenase maturation nickel metallochaperone HypA [Bacillaceae]MBO0958271.1 hydrogenase maturation nickel metallochaperone HypA [Neobacillus sp. MM2021_6]NHC17871.1 hydrogenase maturation nickel metallochaperone HypA [Bacillus sp. MM2020_4]
MHEMSLMGDILQLVQEDAAAKGIQKVEKVELIVGEIANAMPDALRMAFDLFRAQNLHLFSESAELVIHLEEAKAKCVLCGKEYRPDQKIALCPCCLVPSGQVLAGETFQVLSYEGSQ